MVNVFMDLKFSGCFCSSVDGLHPSSEGHNVLHETLAKELQKMIRQLEQQRSDVLLGC